MSRVRALGMCLIAVVITASCTSEDNPPAASAEVWRVPRIEDGTTTGMATAFTTLDSLQGADQPRRPPPGALELRACRARGPGLRTFDVSFEPDDDADFPVTFPLSLSTFSGDMGSGRSGDVTLTGGGGFSVTVNENQRQAESERATSNQGATDDAPTLPFREASWHGSPWSAASPVEVSCEISWDSDDEEQYRESGPPVAMTVDVYDDGLEMPEGSLEALARSVDLTVADEPMLAVRQLLTQEDLPDIDRLYLAPRGPLMRITVSRSAGCLSVESQYRYDEEWLDVVTVMQRLNCPDPVHFAARPVTGIVDDVWDVRITGPRATLDRFVADELERWYMATVEPFAPGVGKFDPAAAADAEVSERGLTEVARFRWRDGVIVVVVGAESNYGPDYEPIIVLPGGPFMGGGGGMLCRTHAHHNRYDGREGFAVVVTESPGMRAVLESEGATPIEVDLEPVAGGREAGLVDLRDVASPETIMVTVTDADGVDVGCDQSPTTIP